MNDNYYSEIQTVAKSQRVRWCDTPEKAAVFHEEEAKRYVPKMRKREKKKE